MKWPQTKLKLFHLCSFLSSDCFGVLLSNKDSENKNVLEYAYAYIIM